MGCCWVVACRREDLLSTKRGKGMPSEIGISPVCPAIVTPALDLELLGWGADEVEAALVLGLANLLSMNPLYAGS